MVNRRVNHLLAGIVATGFGSGYAPFASGTAGSAACLVVWLVAARAWGQPTLLTHTAIIFVVVVLGLLSTRVLVSGMSQEASARFSKPKDPSIVVVDEWAGMLIALFGVSPYDLFQVSIAFLSFRLFDVIKLEPARRLEKLPGAWGIMADDLAAGIYAALATWAVSYLALAM
ncbi:MAG: phosphatidylglycerophosphatase A [Proteobacteria bacterium]|nr:MAG: phosphatidylglycerophosphatase A [Pseudomonadota bacterium]